MQALESRLESAPGDNVDGSVRGTFNRWLLDGPEQLGVPGHRHVFDIADALNDGLAGKLLHLDVVELPEVAEPLDQLRERQGKMPKGWGRHQRRFFSPVRWCHFPPQDCKQGGDVRRAAATASSPLTPGVRADREAGARTGSGIQGRREDRTRRRKRDSGGRKNK
ncbi:hypothetical protein EYF80_060412 [Liparis tanakae]|uniref:Uncharacterized protein n=1 Tax=Liparis tanakae TaxID=230148 RepID=A0A4Z2EKV3_9TELE|nr:hypothetical protein EYF80_060412 [Liparis tanakae]